MAARAMWKGVLRFGSARVPVKLFAALEDRDVHFRLLHAADGRPVQQILVNPESEAVVPYAETKRALQTDAAELVILREEELASVEPPASREIEVAGFLRVGAIDHRWYRRPYYLGPDTGGEADYSALGAALQRLDRRGLARWTMRKKQYWGVLGVHRGYPMLTSLRHAEEVVAFTEFEAPSGPQLAAREVDMARQLVGMLAGPFDPGAYRDEYRERVLELVRAKAGGAVIRLESVRRRRPTEDLTQALEASLERRRA